MSKFDRDLEMKIIKFKELFREISKISRSAAIRLEEVLFTIFDSSRRVSTIAYLIIAAFFILKGLFHSFVLAGEYEEYLKLRFVTRISGYEYFAPWSGFGGDFFGHPGMMNLMFYKWSHWFGLNLESARMFCLSMSTLMIGFFYSVTKKKISHEVAFFSAMALLALPIFQVESILFLFEIGSYTLALIGLFFYYRNYLLFYALFSSMAFLYLESSIAFPLAVLIYEALKQRHLWRCSVFRPLVLLCPLFVAAGFFVVKNHFDPGGGHLTEDLVVRRLLNPMLILQEVDFKQLWMARWVTLEESVPILFWIIFYYVVVKNYKMNSSIHGKDYLFVIGIAAFFQLIFGSFFSEHMGGSDFYAGFFLILLVFFSSIEKWKFFRLISLVSLAIIISHSVQVLHRPLYGWTQAHLAEYSRSKEVEFIKKEIEKIPGGPFKCHVAEFDYHPMFCSDFFRMRPKNIVPVEEIGDSEIFIFSDSKKYEMERVFDYNFLLNRREYLGRLHGLDLYMYFVEKN